MTRKWAPAALLLFAVACEHSSSRGVAPTGPSGIVSPPLTQTFTISGLVFETTADGVRPMPGFGVAREILSGTQTGDPGWMTDRDGRYAIQGLSYNSRIQVIAGGPSYDQPCAATATITSDVAMDIEITLGASSRRTLRASPTLSGTVFEKGPDGVRRPASAAEVYYTEQCRGAVIARTYADADGRYELCRLPLGAGCVTLGATGEWDYDFKITSILIQGDTVLDIEREP